MFKALTSAGWYDETLKTEATGTTIKDVDPNYATSKSYILYGGLAAVVIDAYVIAMSFLGGPPSAPAAEEVPATEAPVDGETSLFNW